MDDTEKAPKLDKEKVVEYLYSIQNYIVHQQDQMRANVRQIVETAAVERSKLTRDSKMPRQIERESY